ncbi:MAG: phosphoribosylformylglycinamidine synthase subunit PurS [Chloroflexi bacterium]|nr:phosphoribosylformylglycinamidine synthase subunit PurS [Chloroflexota bacterium]
MSTTFFARVYVTLKPAVNDPQGITIKSGLQTLGFAGVQQVRAGKYIEVTLEADGQGDAEAKVTEMCKTLLANLVIEDYRFEVEGASLQPIVS